MTTKRLRAYVQVIVGSALGLMMGFGLHQALLVQSTQPTPMVASASEESEQRCHACVENSGCAQCNRDQADCLAQIPDGLIPADEQAMVMACAAAATACRNSKGCPQVCAGLCGSQACSGLGGFCNSGNAACCAGQNLTCNVTTNRCETVCKTTNEACTATSDCCSTLTCLSPGNVCGDPCGAYIVDGKSECLKDNAGISQPPFFPPSDEGGVCGPQHTESCYVRENNLAGEPSCRLLTNEHFCEDPECVNGTCVDPCGAKAATGMPACAVDGAGNPIAPSDPPGALGAACGVRKKCYYLDISTTPMSCPEQSAVSSCEPDLACEGDPNTCKNLCNADGATCAASGDCCGGNCDVATHQCKPLVGYCCDPATSTCKQLQP